MQQWRQHWVPPLAAALLDSDAATRGRVAAYALPVVLRLDPACVHVLLAIFCAPVDAGAATPSNGAAAAVLVLRAAKNAAVFSSLDEVATSVPSAAGDGPALGVLPAGLIMAAAMHRDEALRLDVLELAALSTKSASVRAASSLQCCSEAACSVVCIFADGVKL